MKRILLIITGSIACYKSLDLIRQLRKNNFEVNCILTKSAREFITPLLVSSLTGNKKSTIAKASDIAIVIKSKEACPLDLAPTSSTTAALAFGDALAIALLESKGFTKKDFEGMPKFSTSNKNLSVTKYLLPVLLFAGLALLGIIFIKRTS